MPVNNKPVDELPPTPPPASVKIQIPSWIKENAKLWSDGLIDDNTFVVGLQYLIQHEFIVIPISDSLDTTSNTDTQIPSWIKENAKLWSDGLIDDNTFVVGLQYLIQQGTITISPPPS